MGDTKETRPSRHNKNDIDMKSPDWQNAHGLNRSKPDGVPVLGGEVDMSVHPYWKSYL